MVDLFLAFNWIALQGFGGVVFVAQRELVERKRWLTVEQFIEMLSFGQVLPGPNVVNVSLIVGDRFFGARGAFVASAGLLLAPLAIVIALAALYGEVARLPMVGDAMRGMGAVTAGLIIATAFKLARALRHQALGLPLSLLLAVATLVLVAVLNVSLIVALASLGSVGILGAWWKLR